MNYDFGSLKNIINSINIDFDVNVDAIKDSKIFNNINKCINTLKVIRIKKTNSVNINKIHDKNQHPIMYLVIKRLKDLNLLDKLYAYTINMDDFITFTAWYREHSHILNITKLKNILQSSHDEELLRYYDVLFNPPDDRQKIHEMIYNNNFVSIDIQHHYESENITYEQYEGQDLKINLYKLNSDTDTYIDRIVTTVSLMRMISREYNGSVNPLTLNLFLGHQTKQITTNSGNPIPLCSDNINSGSCLPGKFVNIWRKEELIKVLVHELIHFHGFDFNHMDHDYNKLQQVIDSKINVNGTDRCNESYTESLAILIYLCIMSKLLNIPFDTLFAMELKFLLFQVCKTIKYFKGSSIRDMFRITFLQNTSVRSYFIIKLIILINFNRFVNFIDLNGCVMINKIELYGNFIESILAERKFIVNTSKIFNSINLMDNSFSTKTMRMSLFDFV